MKITLDIPDSMRIGGAIWLAIGKEFRTFNYEAISLKIGLKLADIEDQDLLALLSKLK